MAVQNASSPASRNTQMASKVAVGNGPKMATKSQPLVGKIGGDMNSMSGSKGKGQGVKTVPSNPISGAKSAQPGNTSMGSGSVKSGFV